MPVLGLTAAAEALKLFYLPGLRYQLNDAASVLLAQLEKTTENVVGSEIVLAMRYGRVGGIGNRSDTGTLPTPNSRKTKKAQWETKNIFARFQISDKTIKASKSSSGAFNSLLEKEISDCERDAKLDLSRQVLGSGAGVLCTVSSASGLTLTVNTTMYLAEGMLVDIYTNNTKDTSEAEITAVNHSTNTIHVTSATGAAQNDVIYLAGNKGLELTGLESVFTSTTLYGLNVATYPWLSPYRRNLAGEIEEVTIQAAIDEADTRAGAVTNFLLCSKGVRRAYQDLLTAQKQTVNSLDLKGGFKALSYTGGDKEIPLVADKYVKPGKMYGLDLNDWAMYRMADWEWMDSDGAMLSRVANTPAYEATLLSYCDIGCQRPKGQFEIYGITEH